MGKVWALGHVMMRCGILGHMRSAGVWEGGCGGGVRLCARCSGSIVCATPCKPKCSTHPHLLTEILSVMRAVITFLFAQYSAKGTALLINSWSLYMFFNLCMYVQIEMRLSEIERQVKDQVGSEEEAIRQYKELRSHISELQAAMRAVYMQPQYCLAFLKAGRIVSVYDKQVWQGVVGRGRKQVWGVRAAAVLPCFPQGGTHRVSV